MSIYFSCYFQAKDFRKFWGERCDLRRFPDSSIREAVVWKGNNMANKRAILGKVVRYILQK